MFSEIMETQLFLCVCACVCQRTRKINKWKEGDKTTRLQVMWKLGS